jgi:hypothetical protein
MGRPVTKSDGGRRGLVSTFRPQILPFTRMSCLSTLMELMWYRAVGAHALSDPALYQPIRSRVERGRSSPYPQNLPRAPTSMAQPLEIFPAAESVSSAPDGSIWHRQFGSLEWDRRYRSEDLQVDDDLLPISERHRSAPVAMPPDSFSGYYGERNFAGSFQVGATPFSVVPTPVAPTFVDNSPGFDAGLYHYGAHLPAFGSSPGI